MRLIISRGTVTTDSFSEEAQWSGYRESVGLGSSPLARILGPLLPPCLLSADPYFPKLWGSPLVIAGHPATDTPQ